MTAAPLDGVLQRQRRIAHALLQHQRGEFAAAMAIYREVMREDPCCIDAAYLLGVACIDSGAPRDALAHLGRALHLAPAHVNAQVGMATALQRIGEYGPALQHAELAIGLQPNLADVHFMHGNLLQTLGRTEQSADSYLRAVALRPAFAEAFNNLSAALRSRRDLHGALRSAERALELKSDYALALNNRGLALLDMRRVGAAVASFREALQLNPGLHESLHNLGTALMRQQQYSQAGAAFGRLAAVAPAFRHVQGNLLDSKLACCEWENLGSMLLAVRGAVQRGEHAALPMSFLCVSDSAALQLQCGAAYTSAFYPSAAPPETRRFGHSRIRIAYLSGDFGEHAVSYLLAGVWERHDRSRFDTIAVSWDRQSDGAMRRRVQSAFAQFIDCTTLDDATVARQLRALEVDIVIDLNGHTLGQRTGILAQRAAPVQINYLGLPASMGASYIDYLIADRFLVPEDRRSDYTERIVWLPDAFQPNDDRRELLLAPASREQYGIGDDVFVFASFNRNCKLTPELFDLWMRLLQAHPRSILWLLADNPESQTNLRRRAALRGVAAERLLMAGQVAYREYLQRYQYVDLVLDTAPFNGGTTSSDALSMGAPVLTLAGDSFSARMAGGLLASLDLHELITDSLPTYEARALALARDPQRLQYLKERVDSARRAHPVFDTERYCRHLEAAFTTMWERNEAGLPPQSFAVAPVHSHQRPIDASNSAKGAT